MNVSETQLEHLLSFDFRVRDIAHMLHVSESTVKRRIIQFGFENKLQRTDSAQTSPNLTWILLLLILFATFQTVDKILMMVI